MLIVDILKAEKITAMKKKDSFVKTILTTLIGEIEIIGKNDGNRKTTDEEAIKVIQKFLKGVKDTEVLVLAEIEKTGEDLVEKMTELSKEKKIYEAYLPTLMSEDELSKLISDMIDALPNPNIGMIMGQLKKSGYTYDGKMASKLIREKL